MQEDWKPPVMSISLSLCPPCRLCPPGFTTGGGRASLRPSLHIRHPTINRESQGGTMKGSMLRLSAAALAGVLFAAVTRAGRHDDQGRPRRGRGRYRRLARLYRARRQRQELRLGHRLREADRLQGQRQDRRHLRRDGVADERRRLRSGHRLGRRHAAPDRRQDGAGGQYRPDPELEDHRPAAAERRLAHGGRQSLRRALSVGAERADVQHQGLQGCAEELERRLRGDEPARRQVEQGPRPGLLRPDLHRRRRPLSEGPSPELGITDPYELDQKQFDAAIELLRGQRQIVQKYWNDATQQVAGLHQRGRGRLAPPGPTR